jgi:hypothetical protein
MRVWRVLTVGALVAVGGCTPTPARGDTSSLAPVRADVDDTSITVELLAHHRRWLVEAQTMARWCHEVVDTLQSWWRTPELRQLSVMVQAAERRIVDFAAQRGAPRLMTGWSPVDDPDHALAHRYDERLRLGLLNREEGLTQALQAVRELATTLNDGDLDHPGIAQLMSAITLSW